MTDSKKERESGIEREQAAFDAQLDDLLAQHAGQFTLFKDGDPVAFFDSFTDAYAEGVARFGLDDAFLVSQVAPPRIQSVSVSWDLGVMYAE